MIFYVSDQEENDFMTLFLAHGRLVFMFNVGHKKLKIRSQEKYNDGVWHDVSWRQRNIITGKYSSLSNELTLMPTVGLSRNTHFKTQNSILKFFLIPYKKILKHII